jgi:hypothetical protein
MPIFDAALVCRSPALHRGLLRHVERGRLESHSVGSLEDERDGIVTESLDGCPALLGVYSRPRD